MTSRYKSSLTARFLALSCQPKSENLHLSIIQAGAENRTRKSRRGSRVSEVTVSTRFSLMDALLSLRLLDVVYMASGLLQCSSLGEIYRLLMTQRRYPRPVGE
jgi:hypothetical protein